MGSVLGELGTVRLSQAQPTQYLCSGSVHGEYVLKVMKTHVEFFESYDLYCNSVVVDE